LFGFARQHFNYGRGRVDLVEARRRRGSSTGLDNPGMYASLVTAPFGRHGPWRGLHLATLNILSQAAYAAGFISARLTR
jgi:hypothetical protein